MIKYIAILRGINVGGNRKILMTDLKALFENMGFQNVQTYIQSGNVLFQTMEISTASVETSIANEILKNFGFQIPVIILSSSNLKRAISINPFYKGIDTDIDRLHLTFLKQEPLLENLQKIKTFQDEKDDFKIVDRNAFIYCSGKYSDSKFNNKFFETKLKVTATTRNWKTVLKLSNLISDKE